jgi:hypothetical protein
VLLTSFSSSGPHQQKISKLQPETSRSHILLQHQRIQPRRSQIRRPWPKKFGLDFDIFSTDKLTWWYGCGIEEG